MARALLLLMLSGCDLGSELVLDPPWPEGETAIVVVTDLAGSILPPTPAFSGDRLRFAIDTRESLILYARTFTELEGRDLAGCRVSMDAGVDLGMPSGSWSSGSFRPGDRIELVREEPPREFNLRLVDCELPPKSCELIGRHIEAPTLYSGLFSVAALTGTEALAGGGPQSEQDFRSAFVRYDGTIASDLRPSEGIQGYRAYVDNDRNGVVGGAAFSFFRFDFEGQLVFTGTVSFEVASVSTGYDGTTMFAGRYGEIAAMSNGSTVLREIAPPQYRDVMIPDEPKVATIQEGLFLLYGKDSILYLYDGGTWSELLDEVLDAIAVDERWFFAVPAEGAALILDREVGEWNPVGNLFLTERAKQAAAFGDGRFVAAGQLGRMGYYNGERFCAVATGVDKNIDDIDISPDGRTVYAVGDLLRGAPSEPILIRFTFPE